MDKPVVRSRCVYTSENGKVKVMKVTWPDHVTYEVRWVRVERGMDPVANMLEAYSDMETAMEDCERLSK